MYKRDGVVRLSQSTVPKYGVNVHNVRVHFIDISLHEICDLALRFYRHNTCYREIFCEIPGKLASRLIRGKNSVNSTIGRKILSELTEDLTYVNPTYPRFVVLKTINIIGTTAFCTSWAKIRLTRVRLIRGLLYIYIIYTHTYIYIHTHTYIYTHTIGKFGCMC